MSRDGVELRVTDRERTLVDVCDRPAYAGGLEEILRSVESLPSVRHGRITDYVDQYRRASLASKVGWLLSLFKDRRGYPERHREKLHAIRARGSVAFEPASRYMRDPEWGVLVPASHASLLRELGVGESQMAALNGREA